MTYNFDYVFPDSSPKTLKQILDSISGVVQNYYGFKRIIMSKAIGSDDITNNFFAGTIGATPLVLVGELNPTNSPNITFTPQTGSSWTLKLCLTDF